MQRTESYRRAQYKRAQKKAYFLVHDVWRYHDQGKYSMSIDELWTFSKKCLTHNRKNCSGDCCKNPRRTKYGKGKNKKFSKGMGILGFKLADSNHLPEHDCKQPEKKSK